MSANLKPHAAAVAMLRLSCRLQRELSEGEQRAQASLYAQALSAYHPGDVREACEDWASRVKWWPELADLLSLVREKQAMREAAARPKLTPPDRRPPPPASDDETLALWAKNDGKYDELIASPNTIVSGRDTLLRIYETIRKRRWEQRPDLAYRYYAEHEEAAE
jgi:hypothetical protein